MSSVNKVILVGRCGDDPTVRYAASGDAVTTISVATEESWKDKAGEKQKKVEWTRVVSFGKLATLIAEYVKKGSLVYIEGKLSSRKWTAKDGQERHTTEVICERVQFLGGHGSGERAEKAAAEPAKAKAVATDRGESGFDDLDDPPF